VDQQLFLLVNGFAKATPWLHTAVLLFAQYGVVLFAGLLMVGWWIARGRLADMAAAVWAPAATLLAVAINQPLAAAVAEPRPYRSLHAILVLAPYSTDPSFASDHATMAGAVAAGLWLVHRHLGIVAAVAAVLMAFARVYIGAHYPQDVLAGLLLGAVVAVVGYAVLAGVLARLVAWLAGTRWQPLVAARHPALSGSPVG
jgi:membrane-associated phospholipid phosphatase